MPNQKKSRACSNIGIACLISTLGASALSLMVASPAAAGCGFLGQFACPPKPIQPGEKTIVKDVGGMYQPIDMKHVFRTYVSERQAKFCHVKDEAQLARFGGRQKVEWVRSHDHILYGQDNRGRRYIRQYEGKCLG